MTASLNSFSFFPYRFFSLNSGIELHNGRTAQAKNCISVCNKKQRRRNWKIEKPSKNSNYFANVKETEKVGLSKDFNNILIEKSKYPIMSV